MKVSLPTFTMPKAITDRLDSASASIKSGIKKISDKLPTVPATSRTTKVGVGAVAVLAAGTAAYVAMSDKQKSRLSNLFTRCTAEANKAGKAVVKFVKENQTAVLAGAATLATVGGVVAYRRFGNSELKQEIALAEAMIKKAIKTNPAQKEELTEQLENFKAVRSPAGQKILGALIARDKKIAEKPANTEAQNRLLNDRWTTYNALNNAIAIKA